MTGTKNSRISFRIADDMNDKIDHLVQIHEDIRDRSDFGNKALEFYIKYLEQTETKEQVIYRAIVSLARHSELLELEEIQELMIKFAGDPLIVQND